MASHSIRLLNARQELERQSGRMVLATIIETLGSTYQKAGARMLISENGTFGGLLGGGCFESDLVEQAASVFADGQAKVVFYDMRSPDDAVWGLGLGCNGAVRIFLQLLTEQNHYYPLDIIEDFTTSDATGVLATIVESGHDEYEVGHSTFLEADKDSGRFSLTCDPLYAKPARQVLLNGKPQLYDHDPGGKRVRIFYDLFQPAPKLLILGAGPDVVPVTRFAGALDWHVTVVDHRPAYIRPERFPHVDRLLNITPADLNDELPLDQFDALVVMTHNIEYDERYLAVIAESRIPYIGLLGPAKRRDRLLDSLGDRAGRVNGRIFGPVGLDIGADSPEEIALSIMAEIQAFLHRRDGRPLHQVDLPLHDRETPN